MEYTLRAVAVIPAEPKAVIDTITDIGRLPDWNIEIPKVVSVPAVLKPGAEWVVTIHAMKTRWNSRSRLLELDRDAGRFSYRSQSDDGNPSFSLWRWEVVEDPDTAGSRVTVEVDVRPRTFLRTWVISRVRRRGLQAAITECLASLGDEAASTVSTKTRRT